jgi:hypothetical protein
VLGGVLLGVGWGGGDVAARIVAQLHKLTALEHLQQPPNSVSNIFTD